MLLLLILIFSPREVEDWALDNLESQSICRHLAGRRVWVFSDPHAPHRQIRQAQIRRGGAELRATLGALRESSPSDRSGHHGRGLYDSAQAGGTGRSRRGRRRVSGTMSLGAELSRNRVARSSKSRACALRRWPVARSASEGV